MRLTRIAIFRPVTTTMFALGLIFLGVISYREFPIQRLPEVTLPSMYYMAWIQDSELSPDETNDQLTRPFEKLVASLPGVKEMHFLHPCRRVQRLLHVSSAADMRFRVIELQDKAAKWAAGQANCTSTSFPNPPNEDSGRLMQLSFPSPRARRRASARPPT